VTKRFERGQSLTVPSTGEKYFSPLLRLGVTGLVLIVLLLATFLTWRRIQTAGESYPGTPYNLPLALDVRLGINDGGSVSDGDLARIEEAGLGWVRQTFPWAEIEPQPGCFEWARWDAIIGRVSDRGLRLLAVLDSAPAWAQFDPENPHPDVPPHEVADFGRFAHAFANRYGNIIDYYQVWDEPNLSEHWGGTYVDPTAYVRLLREGYIQIRHADPSSRVVLAGLAPAVESGPLNLNEVAFLEGVYAAGGAAFFDIAAAKPYGFWHRADDPQIDVSVLNFRRVELLRRVMVAHGDVGKPLWAVAFGWNALPEGWQGHPSAWGNDSEAVQAVDTVAAIEGARRQWPWLGLMFLPPLRPDVSPDDPFVGFSLLDGDGRPRPVYDAVRTLANAPPLAWPGRYGPDHPSARYTGSWRVTAVGADIPPGADVAAAGDARLVIPFYGTRLDLTVRRGDFWGVLYVSIDGGPAGRLPRDAQGRAYLVLYDPLQEAASVTLAAGLSDGPHEAVIIPDGGWGQWAIVGWTVGREADLTPFCIAMVLLTLASTICLVVTAIYLYRSWPLLSTIYRSLAAAYCSLAESLQLALMAVVAAVFYFVPGLLPSLIALTLLSLLILLRPDHGLALVAFSIPFFLRPRFLAGKAFSLVEIGTLLCFAAWMVRRLFRLPSPILHSLFSIRHLHSTIRSLRSADWAVASLLGLGALSLTWADNFGVASRELRVVILEGGLFYLLLRVTAGREGGRLHLLLADALAAGTVAVALIGLWQYFVSGDVITAEGVRRVRALYGSPNNLALFLERVLPLLFALALWGKNPRRRVLYALAVLPVFAGLFLTFSKGALFIGLPVALLFLGLMRGRRAVALALAALAVLAVALLPFVGTERFTNIFDLAEGTAFFRVKLWQSTVNMIADHPLTGVGLDNFLYAYRTRYVLPEASDELNLSHPHNIVLDFWTRLGLGGVAVLLWLVVSFFRAGFYSYRRLPEGDDRALILGLLTSMAGALAHGLIDNAFFLVDLAFVFVLSLAAVQSATHRIACSVESHA
jgi:O-antigen ligase